MYGIFSQVKSLRTIFSQTYIHDIFPFHDKFFYILINWLYNWYQVPTSNVWALTDRYMSTIARLSSAWSRKISIRIKIFKNALKKKWTFNDSAVFEIIKVHWL